MLLYLFLKTRFAIHTHTRTELKVSAIKRVQSKREKERERTHQSLPPLFSLPPPPPFPYVCFPHENGTYLCFIMCLNCCFIVIVNNMMKYINNIGQNTGTSKTGKKVMEKATIKLFADLTQNLNSGSFRTKGLQRERGRKNEEGQYVRTAADARTT